MGMLYPGRVFGQGLPEGELCNLHIAQQPPSDTHLLSHSRSSPDGGYQTDVRPRTVRQGVRMVLREGELSSIKSEETALGGGAMGSRAVIFSH